MQRRVEPELLDELPAADPRAVGSRRDLERLNRWMRHAAIMCSLLRENRDGGELRQIADLGAGDGKFMLRVAEELCAQWPQLTVRLVDRQNLLQAETEQAFYALGWKAGAAAEDVFKVLGQPITNDCDVILANLFLHHFSAERLRRLFAAISERTPLFIALEPQRSAVALVLSRCVALIGCNEITRHDAPISVRAGFCGKELCALWPNAEQWCLREGSAGLCTHFFLARRREVSPGLRSESRR